MARFALAGFLHETNSFAPGLTTYDDFATTTGDETGMRTGDEILATGRKEMNLAPSGFLRRAAQLGHQVVPIFWTSAMPSGTVTQDAFERIMTTICDGLAAAGPFDGIFLDLHGAMVTEGLEDPETEIGRRVRAVAGQTPLVAALDLHGNITAECVEVFSGLVAYRTYPHIDIYETGARCADLLDYLLSHPALKKAFRKLPFLAPPALMATSTEPCHSLYALIDELETSGQAVSASVMQGFLPSDIAEVGPAVFAYAADQAAADQAAGRLERAFLEAEPALALGMFAPAEAVAEAIRLCDGAKLPVVIADVQDNPGGGSPSDTVWLIEELVRQNAPASGVGLLCDPQAAAAAHAAGEGALVSLALGGKTLPGHTPFQAEFRVEKLIDGDFPLTGPMNRGLIGNLGKMAQLRAGNVRIVVTTGRTQANDQAYFRVVGIEPAEMKILVLKSTNHYRADFAPIASHILIAEAPSAIIENPAKIPYSHLRPGVRLGALGPLSR